MVTYCSVPQRKSRKDDGVSFHFYPKSTKLKKVWLIKFRMGKLPSKHAVVCSKHFREEDFVYPAYKTLGKDISGVLFASLHVVNVPVTLLPGYKYRKLSPEAVPSVNMPVRPHDARRPLVRAAIRRRERGIPIRSYKLPQTSSICTDAGEKYQEGAEESSSSAMLELDAPLAEEREPVECDDFHPPEALAASPGDCTPISEEISAEAEELSKEIGIQAVSRNNLFAREQLIAIAKVPDEHGLVVLTGIGSFELFYSITELYTEMRLRQGTRSLSLSDDDAVLLTYMKLYHDLTFSLLAVLFNVHRTTVSNIFKDSVVILASILEHAIFWPTKTAVVNCLTMYFKEYKDTRMVFDCTEIEIERPKDLVSRLLTYSHYKRTYTAKVLVSETPGGLISYVSPAYGGKASDTYIKKECRVLDKRIPHVDSVMVDKGFLIGELCKEKNIKMIRPPFLMKKTAHCRGS
nr:uncharacterized protein LOC126521601 [Dermacentor andersoni]